MTETEAIRLFEESGFNLKNVENQTEAICLVAVEKDGWALRYVRCPTDAICLAAVRNNGRTLDLVKNQTEAICRAAIENDSDALRLVKSQTVSLCLAAAEKDRSALDHIRDNDMFKAVYDALEQSKKDRQEECLPEPGKSANQKRYIVEVEMEDDFIVAGKVSSASGESVPSKEIFDLARHVGFMGTQARAEEVSAQFKPGQLCINRSGGRVTYFEIVSIEGQKVYVKESDKEGNTDLTKPTHQFYEPQRLVLAKNQPVNSPGADQRRDTSPGM